MAFSFGTFFDAAFAAASHLVALAAGAEEKIHEIRASHPMVASALTLAEADFPGLLVIEGIAETVLAMAQSAVNSVQAGRIAQGPAPAVPVTAPSTPQTKPTPAT